MKTKAIILALTVSTVAMITITYKQYERLMLFQERKRGILRTQKNLIYNSSYNLGSFMRRIGGESYPLLNLIDSIYQPLQYSGDSSTVMGYLEKIYPHYGQRLIQYEYSELLKLSQERFNVSGRKMKYSDLEKRILFYDFWCGILSGKPPPDGYFFYLFQQGDSTVLLGGSAPY